MNKKYLAFLFLFVIGTTLFAPCCNVVDATLLPPGWKEDAEIRSEGAEGWAVDIGKGLNTVARWVLSGIIGAVSVILLLLTQGFMELSQTLLAWVTSEGFINIKFTDNLFVNEGWGIVRGLTNIFIVLGLVVTALATILRIESYQMKKTLPLLLIVALLINFTPMLCGLVIDASNIIMNHFLKAGQFLTQNYPSAIGSAISELWREIDSPSGMLATGLLLVGSSLFSAIIFLLFAFLFLLRYIALWMLVILSPLALFCYIFPATKKMWNQWLSQFIQWCFIGIPAAFTIYLANMMTQQMVQGKLLGEISSMGKIMGYIVPVAFLYVGLLMSLQTGAMGADLAIKGFKWTGGMIGAGTKWGAMKATEKPRKKLGDWLKRKPSEDEIKKMKEEKEGLPFGYALRGIPGVRPLGHFLSAGVSEAKRKDIGEKEKKAKGTSLDNQAKMIESVNVLNRIAGLLAAMKDGNIKRLKDQGLLSDEKIKSIMKDAIKTYPTAMRDLRKISPELSYKVAEAAKAEKVPELTLKEAGIYFDEKKDKAKGWENLKEKLFATAKPKDIEDIWDEDTIEAYTKSKAAHLSAAPNQIAAATRAAGRAFIDKYNEEGMKMAEKEGKKGIKGLEEFYKEHNYTIWKYRTGSAAQGVGMGFPGKLPAEKITPAQK